MVSRQTHTSPPRLSGSRRAGLRFFFADPLLGSVRIENPQRQEEVVGNPHQPAIGIGQDQLQGQKDQHGHPADDAPLIMKARSRGPLVFLILQYVPQSPPAMPITLPKMPPISPGFMLVSRNDCRSYP